MHRNAQGGFGTIAAIMILVALAALGAFIVTLSTTQNVGSVLDVRGAEAYAAAASGTEWGAYQAVKAGACPVGTTTLNTTVNGMTVTVVGTLVASGDTVEAGLGQLCSITSTACNYPGATGCPNVSSRPDYVERSFTILTER